MARRRLPRRSFDKNLRFGGKAVDRREKTHIMKAIEQSMIEARDQISSTGQSGGAARCERLFRRRVSVSPQRICLGRRRTSAGLSLSLGSGELSDNRVHGMALS